MRCWRILILLLILSPWCAFGQYNDYWLAMSRRKSSASQSEYTWGHGLRFVGTNAFFGNTAPLRLTNMTAIAYVKAFTIPGQGSVSPLFAMQKWVAGDESKGWMITYYQYYYQAFAGGTYVYYPGFPRTNGANFSCALVQNSTSILAYANGAFQGKLVFTQAYLGSELLSMGNIDTITSAYHTPSADAAIYGAVIFNTNLTAEEISTFTSTTGQPTFLKSDSRIVFCWLGVTNDVGATHGDLLYDQSPNAYTSTTAIILSVTNGFYE